MNPFLPNDIIYIELINLLDVPTFLRYCCVNRRLSNLSNDSKIWRSFIRRDFPRFPYFPLTKGTEWGNINNKLIYYLIYRFINPQEEVDLFSLIGKVPLTTKLIPELPISKLNLTYINPLGYLGLVYRIRKNFLFKIVPMDNKLNIIILQEYPKQTLIIEVWKEAANSADIIQIVKDGLMDFCSLYQSAKKFAKRLKLGAWGTNSWFSWNGSITLYT